MVVPQGDTIEKLLRHRMRGEYPDEFYAVSVNGRPVPAEQWGELRPAEGDTVAIRAHTGRDATMRTVALTIISIGAMVAAPYMAGLIPGIGKGVLFKMTSAAMALGIGAGASWLYNQIFPLEAPGSANLPFFTSLMGTRNQLVRDQPIPRHFGKQRIYPTYGAYPYTVWIGDDQWSWNLYLIGKGPCYIHTHRIGLKALAEFGSEGEDYHIEVLRGYDDDPEEIEGWADQIREATFEIAVAESGEWVQMTTELETDGVILDFDANGWGTAHTDGRFTARAARIEVQYSVVGSGVWVQAWPEEPGGIKELWASTRSYKRWGRQISFRTLWGQRYQHYVRVKRYDDIETPGNVQMKYQSLRWVTMRSIRYDRPIQNVENVALVALRMRSTQEIRGTIDTYNCMVEAVHPVYNGASWSTPKTTAPEEGSDLVTRNPAWAFAEILRNQSGNQGALEDSQLYESQLKDWADFCDAHGLTFDGTYDRAMTVGQALRAVADIGHAKQGQHDLLYTAIIDQERDTSSPAQVFTNRNTFNFEMRKSMVGQPHAVRVEFRDEDSDYLESTVTVYNEGYDVDTATKVDRIEAWGCTNWFKAQEYGYRYLNKIRHQPEVFLWETDLEHLRCNVGDLVKLVHDVPKFGTGTARIKVLLEEDPPPGPTGDFVTGLELDSDLKMEDDKSYGIIIWSKDGTMLGGAAHALRYYAGWSNRVWFVDPINVEDDLPEVGNLVLYGELASIEADLIIQSIRPNNNLKASMEAILYSAEVYQYGEFAPYDPQVTEQPTIETRAPADPIISSIRTDEDALIPGPDGTLIVTMQVVLRRAAGYEAPTDHYVVQTRLYSDEAVKFDWQAQPIVSGGLTTFNVYPVEQGKAYDIRIRAKSPHNVHSAWVTRENILIVGKSTPPDDVPRVYLEEFSLVRWPYSDPPIDLAGFLVRYNAGDNDEWVGAVPVTSPFGDGEVVWHENSAPLSAFPLGEITILVKAVDTSGNESTNAASLHVTKRDYGFDWIHWENIYPLVGKDFGDVGVILQGTQDGAYGPIEGDALGGGGGDAALFWDEDDYAAFWGDDSELFWPASEQGYGPVEYVLKSRLIVTWDLLYPKLPKLFVLPHTYSGTVPRVTYFYGEDDLTDRSNDLPWPGHMALHPSSGDDPEDHLPNIRIYMPGGPVQPTLDYFELKQDDGFVEEHIIDASIASGGSRVTLTREYWYIKSVSVILTNNSGSAAFYRVVDKGVRTGEEVTEGPLIRLYNYAGGDEAGLVDVLIRGI